MQFAQALSEVEREGFGSYLTASYRNSRCASVALRTAAIGTLRPKITKRRRSSMSSG
jgi:hypothetical protein